MNTDAIENTYIFLEIPKTTNPMSVILSDLIIYSIKIEYTAEKSSISKIYVSLWLNNFLQSFMDLLVIFERISKLQKTLI